MPSSIARLTRQDHERLLRLLRRTCTPGPRRDRWCGEFVALLRAHQVAERWSLTTEVEGRSPALEAAAHEASESDTCLDRLAAEVSETDLEAANFEELCARVERALGEHADRLAHRVMLPMETSIARKEMRRLGGLYETRREQELRAQGAAEDTPRRLDLPRAELYELARRAGIEGRSAMSRSELIDALQRQQHD